MSDVTIFHNPNCSTSRFALDTAKDLGVEVDVVKYLSKAQTPDRATLENLVAILEDPVTDLIRRDGNFAKLGIDESAVQDAEGVVTTLLAHPELMQRPVLVRNGVAIIGRPKDRVATFIS